MSEGLLHGKTALVAGVANKRSIAWAIAQKLHEHGAQLAFTYQGERLEGSVRKLANGLGSDLLVDCDVSDDASIARAMEHVGAGLDGLDILVHSIAYAPPDAFQNRFIETSRETFATALDISAYSMIAMARAAEPLMNDGGSMVTLTYMASERVFPGYNVMAVAKAALETSVRYLALPARPARRAGQRDLGRAGADTGRQGHRRLRSDGVDHRATLAARPKHRGGRCRINRALSHQPALADGDGNCGLRRFRLPRDGDVVSLSLTVLGGSPAWPNAGQGASGYLVESDTQRILLDCGSGIASELRLHDPGPLTAVIITHFHADHWFDLVPLHYAIRYGSWRGRPRASLHLPPGGRGVLDTVASVWDGSAETFDAAFDMSEYDPIADLHLGELRFTFAPCLHYTTCYSIRIAGARKDDRVLR